MSDRMKGIPFARLLELITGEYKRDASIFGIPQSAFYRKKNNSSFRMFGERCDTPVGPAAGPHTQLCQNIISAFLCGGRFMELKTVQKMDSLEFDKPCIDARDEAYNTEWSTELSLTEARDEYTKAWIALHLLETIFDLGTDPSEKGFVFNMSIGYDLEGIQTPPMDAFIEGLMDASGEAYYSRYLEELASFTSSDYFRKVFPDGADRAAGIADRISSAVCRSVTLSTMHGCPPEEQESICRYLLTEKGLPTYVKLNPTLLGYRRTRESLDERGFGYIGLKEEAFLHDLQYGDAVNMLESLLSLADKKNLPFGIKLSNTLASVNPQDVLPGGEQYMSGRALFPLTLLLAEELHKDVSGKLPISFAGGASFFNAAGLFSAGIRPITCATELLKPSGYLRLTGLAGSIDETASAAVWDMKEVYGEALTRIRSTLSSSVLFAKDFRGTARSSVPGPLGPYDCYIAPCIEACPIGQDVPGYIRLAGEGRYEDALKCIYESNPLPSVTGTICDHACMSRCSRLDYEGSVLIREVKRIAADRGCGYADTIAPPAAENGHRIAVIGTGPAGLSAAFFLRRAGFSVTVFDKADSAGGVIRRVLPDFRIAGELLDRDISRIEAMGVEFVFGSNGNLTVQGLKSRGFEAIFIGIGAEKSREISIPGPVRVIDSLEFLKAFKSGVLPEKLGPSVAVVGGGNTAMDGARAAVRSSGVKTVYILYRRSEDQMPADREEFDNALADGVKFKPLTLPEECPGKGILRCRVMSLGPPGTDGRPVPVPTNDVIELNVDTVIAAVGEHVDYDALENLGLSPEAGAVSCNPETLETSVPGVYLGGDARTGPSTVVESMADGKKAAEAILRSFGLEPEYNPAPGPEEQESRLPGIHDRRGRIFPPVVQTSEDELVQEEARRCLECDIFCNKCVEVCPNRANIAVPVRAPGFLNIRQIIHIDAFCNECGNCATFCPYDGKPYRDKITLFSTIADLSASENAGFCLNNDGTLSVRPGKDCSVQRLEITNGRIDAAAGLDPRCTALLETVIQTYPFIIHAVLGEKEEP